MEGRPTAGVAQSQKPPLGPDIHVTGHCILHLTIERAVQLRRQRMSTGRGLGLAEITLLQLAQFILMLEHHREQRLAAPAELLQRFRLPALGDLANKLALLLQRGQGIDSCQPAHQQQAPDQAVAQGQRCERLPVRMQLQGIQHP